MLGISSLLIILALQLLWLKKTVAIQEAKIEIQNKEDSLNLIEFSEGVHTALRDVLKEISTLRSDSSDLYGAVKQIRTNRFTVDINEELQPYYLETLLKRSFYGQNIQQDFQYGIYDCFSDSIVYGNLIRVDKNAESGYYIDSNTLTANTTLNWKKDGHYFTVYFPQVRAEKMVSGASFFSPWLYIVLIGLIVALLFWYSLTMILRQKRLSEIKNDFINNMTHELKTPISTISLSSEMLLKEGAANDPEKLQRYAGIIYKENKRLENQVERVLNLAKLDKKEVVLSKSDFSVHEILEEVKEHFIINREDKGGEITLELEAKYPLINADEVHVSNVVYNLIDNAIKYCNEQPHIRIRTSDYKQNLMIEIEDNGIGIRKEDQASIFDKFFRVHTGNRHDVKGFGIGLFYVKSIVIAHKGVITVKSQLGKGSLFTILLPRV
ncbi:MAG: HAMP domain-containing histidine kinase [Bacteroidetes bacterium]|nr:HAMP domain-containing histidine kinase [Bacteroidota bacterium]